MEQVIYTIRNIRGEMKLSPGTATDVYIIGKGDHPDWKTIKENGRMIGALIRTQTRSSFKQKSPPSHSLLPECWVLSKLFFPFLKIC